MKNSKILMVFFVAFLFIGVGCSSGQQEQQEEDKGWQLEELDEDERYPLLIIGVDGVKPTYIEGDYGETPNLDKLIEEGVWARSLKPVFPSHTFPNLYSAVTGLYPENHGILANTVYDAERDERFSMTNSDAQQDPNWWGGEPIWVSAEKQGLTTSTFFWVGSEAPIKGVRPTNWVEYDSRIRHSDRTDQVLRWLVNDGVDFATLYFASPDGAGHSHGPYSQQVTSAMEGVDRQLGRLIEDLERGGLWPDINILIFSDHGMAQLDEEKVVFLDDIIDLRDVHVIAWTPVAMLAPRPGKAALVYEQLKEAEDNFAVYRRDEIPDRYRIRDHERTPEILVVADLPYTLTSRTYFEENGLRPGGHGYDPEYAEMHGFFVAHGPNFPAGHTTDTLHIVDLYSLMTYLLGLEAAPNDGSLERIASEIFGQ